MEPGETPEAAALRETAEEVEIDLDGLEVIGEVVDVCQRDGCAWTYRTVVATLPERRTASPRTWESQGLAWTALADLQDETGPPLHAGLRRALPRIVEATGSGSAFS